MTFDVSVDLWCHLCSVLFHSISFAWRVYFCFINFVYSHKSNIKVETIKSWIQLLPIEISCKKCINALFSGTKHFSIITLRIHFFFAFQLYCITYVLRRTNRDKNKIIYFQNDYSSRYRLIVDSLIDTNRFKSISATIQLVYIERSNCAIPFNSLKTYILFARWIFSFVFDDNLTIVIIVCEKKFAKLNYHQKKNFFFLLTILMSFWPHFNKRYVSTVSAVRKELTNYLYIKHSGHETH